MLQGVVEVSVVDRMWQGWVQGKGFGATITNFGHLSSWSEFESACGESISGSWALALVTEDLMSMGGRFFREGRACQGGVACISSAISGHHIFIWSSSLVSTARYVL